jgi:hypothetical protein
VVLFGRTEGGAWSIAGAVARGVGDWSSARREQRGTPTSPFVDAMPPMRIPDARLAPPVSPPALADTEDLPPRRI